MRWSKKVFEYQDKAYNAGFMDSQQIAKADVTPVREALRKLLDWGREFTSPRDANSPHKLLIEADLALNGGEMGDET